MAAILRVKRRRSEDPAESLVILSKRCKQSLTQDEASSVDGSAVDSIFKFAGTVDKKVDYNER